MCTAISHQEATALSRTHNLRILHIASGDLWAGAEAQLYVLAKTLHCSCGATVSVVLLNHGKLECNLRKLDIKVTVLNEKQLNSLQILSMLIRTIRDQQPDVIHTHRTKENILGSAAAFLAGNIPSIRTTHGAPEHYAPWQQVPKHLIRALDWLSGRFIQRRIIAVSENLADIMEGSFPANRIRVIENGIDLKIATNHGKTINEPIAIEKNSYNIGFAGRLVPIKRVDILIATAKYMLDKYPHLKVSFHIYGEGPLGGKLKSLSDELGTGDTVYFEGHSNDIARSLKTIDVLLITSDHEGLPMILLEAMALRVPIIAHAVGGIPNLLNQGSCGILIQKQLASEYGDAIHRLLKDQGKYNIIREKAFTRVTGKYSAEEKAHAYMRVYSSITKNNS